MSNTHRTASCICGAIQINVTGAHCGSCQKATGVIFASNVVYKGDVRTTYLADKRDDPAAVLKMFEDTQSSDSGTVILRSFCAICGSRVTGQRQGSPDRVVMGMGLFGNDGDGRDRDLKAEIKPTSEYFCINRTAWLGEIQGALRVLRRCRKLHVATSE
ncbi:hypothetical protein PG997_002949 [Apiospora hydei]|uniref:CENP-V/GFA domain-containing protein n=1 Tax=Apiospora hydei TaxID=1337664 RepID=A0ABR1WXW0_9PEZI